MLLSPGAPSRWCVSYRSNSQGRPGSPACSKANSNSDVHSSIRCRLKNWKAGTNAVRVLLDTHTLIWWALNDAHLSRDARSILSSFETEVFVSAASAWEVCTKVRIGKMPGAEIFAAEFPARVGKLGFRELPIGIEHGQRAGLLPGMHRDPFDRMLIAQAQAENMPIVSNERIFDDYHVRRIW